MTLKLDLPRDDYYRVVHAAGDTFYATVVVWNKQRLYWSPRPGRSRHRFFRTDDAGKTWTELPTRRTWRALRRSFWAVWPQEKIHDMRIEDGRLTMEAISDGVSDEAPRTIYFTQYLPEEQKWDVRRVRQLDPKNVPGDRGYAQRLANVTPEQVEHVFGHR